MDKNLLNNRKMAFILASSVKLFVQWHALLSMHVSSGAGSTSSYPVQGDFRNANVWTRRSAERVKMQGICPVVCLLNSPCVCLQHAICHFFVGPTWTVRQLGILPRGHTQTVRAAARGNEVGIVVWHITLCNFAGCHNTGPASVTVQKWGDGGNGFFLWGKLGFAERCSSLFTSANKAYLGKKKPPCVEKRNLNGRTG